MSESVRESIGDKSELQAWLFHVRLSLKFDFYDSGWWVTSSFFPLSLIQR